ncbi:MAG: glycosyl transferase [Deltaproteobacteria bacterium RBG_16_71_12]|nr:MAG: glycosyl transferase [Deltaproteobacteria bacterium RBG_16_71_12]
MKVSLVVPCFNEADNLPRLFQEIDAVIAAASLDAEIILIDDGSADRSRELLVERAQQDARYKAVIFRRNYGQTAAMAAGIDHASGDVIIPLDADLQNDPADVPRLLVQIEAGFDVVSGWRKDRKDRWLSRRLPSVLANWLISRVGGVRIHDYGCTLKAYRKSVLDHVRLYGEMHRFIPILAAWAGGKVTEIVVNHRPRTAGTSKYGIGRTFKVLLDLLTVKLLGSYATKPSYFFGFVGMALVALGVVCGLAVVGIKLGDVDWQHTFSLGLLGAFLMLVGMQSVMMGLLAELQVRTYHESQSKPIYLVKETVGLDVAGTPVSLPPHRRVS